MKKYSFFWVVRDTSGTNRGSNKEVDWTVTSQVMDKLQFTNTADSGQFKGIHENITDFL